MMTSLCVGAIVVLGLVVSVTSFALATAPSFPDVPITHPYYAAITDLASRSIIGGRTDGTFGPADPVTRQQFAKMIVLTGGFPVSEADVCPFSDVEVGGPSTLYPDNYVAVCAVRGITTGKTPSTFDPTGKVTRYQAVSMVVRMADNLKPGFLAAPPATWTGNATWASNPTHGANAARAEYNGLLAGLDLATLDPAGNMGRGEVAQVLYDLLGKLTPATTTTEATTTTTAPASPRVINATTGEERLITFRVVDAEGKPISGLTVEWFMEGVGFFPADDERDISDPNVPGNNLDIDETDTNGQATVFVKSYRVGQQIVKIKPVSGNSFATTTVAIVEWSKGLFSLP